MDKTKKQLIDEIMELNMKTLNKDKSDGFHKNFQLLLTKKTKNELYELSAEMMIEKMKGVKND